MIRRFKLNGKEILSVECNKNHEDCPGYQYISLNKFPYSINNDMKVEKIEAIVFYEEEHKKRLLTVHNTHCKQKGE